MMYVIHKYIDHIRNKNYTKAVVFIEPCNINEAKYRITRLNDGKESIYCKKVEPIEQMNDEHILYDTTKPYQIYMKDSDQWMLEYDSVILYRKKS